MANNIQKSLDTLKRSREQLLERKRRLNEISSKLPAGLAKPVTIATTTAMTGSSSTSSFSTPTTITPAVTAVAISPETSARAPKQVKTTTSTTKTNTSQGTAEEVKNDYSQHFVDTGQRPQNFIRDAELSERFEEYSLMVY